MTTKSSLNDEIKVLVKGWSDDHEAPPYSYEELIAMALALHDEPLTAESIMRWIVSSFGFFRDVAFEALWASSKGESDEEVLRDFTDALNNIDLPVTTFGDPDDTDGLSYQMSATAAIRWALRDFIADERKGIFPFLQLPAELRTNIYDMVFSYPKSGLNPERVSISTGGYDTYFYAATRNNSKEFTFTPWYNSDRELKVSSPGEILALLCVNKQIFAEASACFYRINTFFCGGIESTLHTLQHLAPSRRQHLRHLAFSHDPLYSQLGTELFELLVSLPNLARLDIRLEEQRWLNWAVPRKRKLYFTVATIPGLDILTKTSSSLQVEFAGDCPNLIAYWKPKMVARTAAGELNEKQRKDQDGKRKRLVKVPKVPRKKKKNTSGT